MRGSSLDYHRDRGSFWVFITGAGTGAFTLRAGWNLRNGFLFDDLVFKQDVPLLTEVLTTGDLFFNCLDGFCRADLCNGFGGWRFFFAGWNFNCFLTVSFFTFVFSFFSAMSDTRSFLPLINLRGFLPRFLFHNIRSGVSGESIFLVTSLAGLFFDEASLADARNLLRCFEDRCPASRKVLRLFSSKESLTP